MNDAINYKTNPLHGLSLKPLLIDLVDHYGFEILFAYLNINCFKTKPSIDSSVKFLKKTTWAREKVENFYLYQFKNLPKASHDQYQLPPRDRVVPEHQQPGLPKELSLQHAAQLREQRQKQAVAFNANKAQRSYEKPRRHADQPRPARTSSPNPQQQDNASHDPWAKWR